MRQRARPRTVRRPSQRCTMPVRHTPTRTQATTRGVGVARAHPRPRGFSDYTGVTADSVRPVQIRPIQAQFVKPVLDTGKTDIEHSSGHYGRWRDPDSNRDTTILGGATWCRTATKRLHVGGVNARVAEPSMRAVCGLIGGVWGTGVGHGAQMDAVVCSELDGSHSPRWSGTIFRVERRFYSGSVGQVL